MSTSGYYLDISTVIDVLLKMDRLEPDGDWHQMRIYGDGEVEVIKTKRNYPDEDEITVVKRFQTDDQIATWAEWLNKAADIALEHPGE